VIDDDEDVADIFAAFLTAGGFDVRTANSGSAGIRLVCEIVPHAVVCDMRMPGMGGEEVILLLKSRPSTSHIPVLVVTGYCDEEFVGIGDAFIPKPVCFKELVSAVQQFAA
jgi:two-component system phosphate regulon response regulator PhoB